MQNQHEDSEDAAAEAERRLRELHVTYGSGREFETDVLRECIVATHRFLSEIADEIAADAALGAFLQKIFGGEVRQGGWREKLDDHDGEFYSDLRVGQIFHDLNAYAHHGVALSSGATPGERRAYIHGLLEGAEAFRALIPFKEWGIEGGDLLHTLLLAQGRWALDNGEPVDPRALAVFGGVTERRIRNMMSKTEALFQPKDGRIPADQALDWLRRRPEHFRPSLWKAQDPDEPPGSEPGRLERVVFVPVGADGSVFHPGLKRDGHFLLGAEAEDVRVADYGEALAFLQGMVTPVWRRPTGHEHWTRVQGVRWDRMTMGEIEASSDEAERPQIKPG